MRTYTLKDLPNNDKPRERLLRYGAQSLSDSELLALILGSGGKEETALDVARKLLHGFKGFYGLNQASVEQLISINHIGLARASSIKALGEIALRMGEINENGATYVKSPEDIYKITKRFFYGKRKEELHLISLDSRNKVVAKDVVSVGTINETMVHPREIFRQALLRNAVSVILVHNHPSQDTVPSSEDIVLTEKVAKAGKMLGIALMDHLIVCDSDYCSLKALGIFNTFTFGNDNDADSDLKTGEGVKT